MAKKIYLTDHFTLQEAVKSQTALRKGIDNTPTDAEKKKLAQVALHILEPVRRYFNIPFSPSSWFRCLELNRELGSNDDSQHVKAEAVDFEIPGIDNLTLAYWVMENIDFDQIILECHEPGDPNSGWVHASFVDPYENRGEVWTYSNGQYTMGLPDLEG